MAEQRYLIMYGYRGDKFLVPCERKADFAAWVDRCNKDQSDAEAWLEPEYARPIAGDLTFERPLVFGRDPWHS